MAYAEKQPDPVVINVTYDPTITEYSIKARELMEQPQVTVLDAREGKMRLLIRPVEYPIDPNITFS